jgi:hypothetical protein
MDDVEVPTGGASVAEVTGFEVVGGGAAAPGGGVGMEVVVAGGLPPPPAPRDKTGAVVGPASTLKSVPVGSTPTDGSGAVVGPTPAPTRGPEVGATPSERKGSAVGPTPTPKRGPVVGATPRERRGLDVGPMPTPKSGPPLVADEVPESPPRTGDRSPPAAAPTPPRRPLPAVDDAVYENLSHFPKFVRWSLTLVGDDAAGDVVSLPPPKRPPNNAALSESPSFRASKFSPSTPRRQKPSLIAKNYVIKESVQERDEGPAQ